MTLIEVIEILPILKTHAELLGMGWVLSAVFATVLYFQAKRINRLENSLDNLNQLIYNKAFDESKKS